MLNRQLTEISDLVAKYRPDQTSGKQNKPEVDALETGGSKGPKRLCRRPTTFLIRTLREQSMAHGFGSENRSFITLRASRVIGSPLHVLFLKLPIVGPESDPDQAIPWPRSRP